MVKLKKTTTKEQLLYLAMFYVLMHAVLLWGQIYQMVVALVTMYLK